MVRFSIFIIILIIILSVGSMGQTTNSSGSDLDEISSFETCSTNVSKTWIVDDTESATILAEAVNCSGGSFNATWRGSVLVERTIIIPEGTSLNVTGEGSGAEINGGGDIRLFMAVGANLHINGLTLRNGNASYGGAMYVTSSNVSWDRETSFIENTASYDGGALHIHDKSNVSWYGETSFVNNTARDDGGAMYIESESTVSWDGNTLFLNNMAGEDGGAIYLYSNAVISWYGETSFIENVASTDGGAVYIRDQSSVSWGGNTSFVDNVAVDDGGAIYLSMNVVISWDGDTSFVNNTAIDDGGAMCIESESTVSWDGNTLFLNNMAGEDGGALDVDFNSVTSWDGETFFIENTASNDGGAVYIRDQSNVSWGGNALFLNNTAGNRGGALYMLSSTTSWDGVTSYNQSIAEFGGGLYVWESNVSWDGQTSFVNNTAVEYGGALRGYQDSDISWGGVTSFVDNRAEYGGALAVYDTSTVVTWTGVTSFTANEAISDGGAIYATLGCNVNVEGDTNFTKNVATVDGGAILLFLDCDDATTSYFIFKDNPSVLFYNNTCGGNGGALALIGEAVTRFSLNTTFLENTAGVAGGAIYLSGVTGGIRFEGTKFMSNSAVIGGGLYSTGSGTTISGGGNETSDHNTNTTALIGCTFLGNKATKTGGAMDSSRGIDTIVNTCFEQNTALIGGALSLVGTSSLIGCKFIENSAFENEGPAISNDGVITNLSSCSFVDNVFNCEEGYYIEFDSTDDAQLGDSCAGCSIDCTNCIFEGKRPTKCVEALENTNATGTDNTLESLLLDPGYWRATKRSVNILECYNSKACLGGLTGNDNYCLEGYEGPYCSVCSEGYISSFGSTCKKCDDNVEEGIALAVILAILVLFAFVALVLHTVSGEMGGADQGIVGRMTRLVPLHSIKIIIVVWQIITQFSTVGNVVFPGVYQNFLDRVDILNFDLSWVLSIGCMADTDFHDHLLLVTMGPLVCMVILGVTYIAAISRNRSSEEDRGKVSRKHVSMVLLLTFLVYSSVSSTLFKTFACEILDDGKNYLRADYRIECTSFKHNVLEVYAGFMAILYVVGIPALYGVLLYTNRKALMKNTDREEDKSIKPITDLWKPYRPERYFYEVVECVRRVLLTGALVFIYPNTAGQIAVALMMTTVFIFVSEVLAPYASPWDTWINRTGHATVFMSIFLALLLKVDITREHASSQMVFESVLIAAHSCLLLVVLIQAIVMVIALREEVKEHSIPQMRRGYSNGVGKVGAFLEDEAPPSYENKVENEEKSYSNQVMSQSQAAA